MLQRRASATFRSSPSRIESPRASPPPRGQAQDLRSVAPYLGGSAAHLRRFPASPSSSACPLCACLAPRAGLAPWLPAPALASPRVPACKAAEPGIEAVPAARSASPKAGEVGEERGPGAGGSRRGTRPSSAVRADKAGRVSPRRARGMKVVAGQGGKGDQLGLPRGAPRTARAGSAIALAAAILRDAACASRGEPGESRWTRTRDRHGGKTPWRHCETAALTRRRMHAEHWKAPAPSP